MLKNTMHLEARKVVVSTEAYVQEEDQQNTNKRLLQRHPRTNRGKKREQTKLVEKKNKRTNHRDKVINSQKFLLQSYS